MTVLIQHQKFFTRLQGSVTKLLVYAAYLLACQQRALEPDSTCEHTAVDATDSVFHLFCCTRTCTSLRRETFQEQTMPPLFVLYLWIL